MTWRSDLHRRFFRLTLLNILANITVPLVGLVDAGMLGHLPEIRFLAGVALASILFDYLYWSFGFLRMGTTGTTAQEIGKGNSKEAYHVLYRSILLASGLALLILIIQVPLREVGFLLLKGTPGVEEAGRSYFNIRIWAAPAVLCNFAFLGWYLGREQSGRALLITVIANLSNVVLNYVFIVRLQLAAMGAGLATMLSQYVMLGVALVLFFRLGGRPAWCWHELVGEGRLSKLLRLNRDILVRTLCLISAFAVFTNFSSMLGTVVLAGNTILLRLLMFAAYLVDGAAFATESLAGVLRGAGRKAGLVELTRLALVAGETFALLFLGALYLFSGKVYLLLTSHEQVLEFLATYGAWLFPALGFGALAYIYDGLFLGLTSGGTLRKWMLFSTLAVFLPISLSGLYLGSNHLLWFALAAFMLARAGTLWSASRKLVGN